VRKKNMKKFALMLALVSVAGIAAEQDTKPVAPAQETKKAEPAKATKGRGDGEDPGATLARPTWSRPRSFSYDASGQGTAGRVMGHPRQFKTVPVEAEGGCGQVKET
jgi:hypothetical protein